jgi:hypothetical protein
LKSSLGANNTNAIRNHPALQCIIRLIGEPAL